MAAQDMVGKFLLYYTPEKGSGVSRSRAAILPDPVQFGKELALVKEPLRVCFGRIGTAGVKCCLKAIGKCETESHERTRCTLPEDIPFFIQLHGPYKEQSNIVLDVFDLDSLMTQEALLETEGLKRSSLRLCVPRKTLSYQLSTTLVCCELLVGRCQREPLERLVDADDSISFSS